MLFTLLALLLVAALVWLVSDPLPGAPWRRTWWTG
jgi:hypothetical protein